MVKNKLVTAVGRGAYGPNKNEYNIIYWIKLQAVVY